MCLDVKTQSFDQVLQNFILRYFFLEGDRGGKRKSLELWIYIWKSELHDPQIFVEYLHGPWMEYQSCGGAGRYEIFFTFPINRLIDHASW